MSCDTCGKATTDLTQIRDIYQTPKIKMVCDDCRHVIDKQLDSIRDMTYLMQQGLLKRFMETLRSKIK